MRKHQQINNLEQLKKKAYQEVDEYSKRIHRVFNTEDGRMLLDVWTDYLMMEPSDSIGKDLYSLGLSDGRKKFIRDLIIATKQAEAR